MLYVFLIPNIFNFINFVQKCMAIEFTLKSWQYWHLTQMHRTIFKECKRVHFFQYYCNTIVTPTRKALSSDCAVNCF